MAINRSRSFLSIAAKAELQGVLLQLPVHVLAGEGNVERRCFEAAVTKHLLDNPKLCPTPHRVGTEGMAQGMH
jgi:hypothetical protein